MQAASTLFKPQANILKNLLKRKIFITDCTGRQLPVQPVMKISSKWYFLFQCSCKLNHTNIPCRPCPCVHNMLRPCVFIWNKIHVLYVGLSHLIFSMYPYFEFYVSHIYHMQTAQFHYCHSYRYMGCQMDFILAFPDIDESKYWFR